MPEPLQDERRWTLHEGQGEADWIEGPAFDNAQEVVPASSLSQALAERDRLAEVAEELAEALRGIDCSTRNPDGADWEQVDAALASYESLRGGADG